MQCYVTSKKRCVSDLGDFGGLTMRYAGHVLLIFSRSICNLHWIFTFDWHFSDYSLNIQSCLILEPFWDFYSKRSGFHVQTLINHFLLQRHFQSSCQLFKRGNFHFFNEALKWPSLSSNQVTKKKNKSNLQTGMFTFIKMIDRLGIRVTGGSNETREDLFKGPEEEEKPLLH